ncbi:hypothetical protein MKZ38_003341 [Zalerion maritima]|uniref:Uncharacterized protein n=1 Tax=Zalerion maritima TaxID=339359 RepID=A0AAD5RMW3_9PEZI|nr:hypothetical protein MKZ38_003341 [Zalerion maritima]
MVIFPRFPYAGLKGIKRTWKGKKGDDDERRGSAGLIQPIEANEEQLLSSSPPLRPLQQVSTSISSYGQLGEGTLVKRSSDRKNEPLGLQVLYQPEDGHRTIDIIFVHGLGGTSQLSWSWNRDLSCFWPGEWLPTEPEIRKDARILSFGYNADFMSLTATKFNITEFANILLSQMKFGRHQDGSPLQLGKFPIMFVTHSMGGLVFKKAYILGFNNPNYQDIIRNVCSVIFLATPHSGSKLAGILNSFFAATLQTPKPYVADLEQRSHLIQDINEQFRNYENRLRIVSFFETQGTTVGPKKIIVVDKDSAVIGYGNEIQIPLEADHHTVCKYPSINHPNYVSVRDVIQYMVAEFKLKVQDACPSIHESLASSPSILDRLIESPGHYREYLEDLTERCDADSCTWIHDDPTYSAWWADQEPGASVLCLTGFPGVGKSILASYLVRNLEDKGELVQFFFFRFDDQARRSVRNCLLSIVYQMAQEMPGYSRRIQDLKDITSWDIRAIWQRAIQGALTEPRQLFWVVDAVDECESPQALLNLMSLLYETSATIRVILTSRPQSFTRHSARLKTSPLGRRLYHVADITSPEESLRQYVEKELRWRPWNGDVKQRLATSLLERSTGNFLWLHLVIRKLLGIHCNSFRDVERAISETPKQLDQVYLRIESAVSEELQPEELELSRKILTWITCSKRQLSLEELFKALQLSSPMLDLREAIGRLCGEFVVVSGKGIVSMVHHSAKEFLIHNQGNTLSIDQAHGNQAILAKCLDILLDPMFQIHLRIQGCTDLLRYAAVFWADHLSATEGNLGVEDLEKVATFLKGQSVLGWMNAVGMTKDLRVLTSAAKYLTSFVEKRKRLESNKNPMTRPLEELEVLSSWAAELVRIVGKFGFHLVSHPRSVYTLIPTFCPPNSLMARQFATTPGNSRTFLPHIERWTNPNWDDSLAKFTIGGSDFHPSRIFPCPDDAHFAVLASDKMVILYYALTFQEARRFDHGEMVMTQEFNHEGDRLVTCGSKSIKVWDVSSGRVTHIFPNPKPSGVRATKVSFDAEDKNVIICCDDSRLRYRALRSDLDGSDKLEWTVLPRKEQDDPSRGLGSPICVAFNANGTQVAVSIRGAPLIAWSTENGALIGTSERLKEKLKGSGQVTWCYAQRLTWNPTKNHVVGIYNEGTLFKWDPVKAVSEEPEIPITATEVACSPDGNFFVTASGDGSLRVWNFENFHLIYHLSCMSKSTVTDVAVSRDGRRIYDLRESTCSVWEPNPLIRMADEGVSESSSSHAGSSASIPLALEESADILDPITAVVFSERGKEFCYCNDSGMLKVSFDGEQNDIEIESGCMGISKLAWSSGGQYIAAAEIGGTITIWQIIRSQTRRSLREVFEARAENTVWTQLFFEPTNSYLVASSKDRIAVWEWKGESGSPTAARHFGNERLYWILHPGQPNQLMAISSQAIYAHTISNLELVSTWKVDFGCQPSLKMAADAEVLTGVPPSGSSSQNPLKVSKVLVSPSSSRMIIQTVARMPDGNRVARFSVIDTAAFNQQVAPTIISGPSSASIDGIVVAKPLPSSLHTIMDIPVGFVSGMGMTAGRLVLIDREFWLSIWDLDDVGGERIQRHFFLPRDWVNAECLAMAQVTLEGSFLCPRNGEVVVVKNGFREPWR